MRDVGHGHEGGVGDEGCGERGGGGVCKEGHGDEPRAASEEEGLEAFLRRDGGQQEEGGRDVEEEGGGPLVPLLGEVRVGVVVLSFEGPQGDHGGRRSAGALQDAQPWTSE